MFFFNKSVVLCLICVVDVHVKPIRTFLRALNAIAFILANGQQRTLSFQATLESCLFKLLAYCHYWLCLHFLSFITHYFDNSSMSVTLQINFPN